MINPYSEEERLQAMISACYTASRSHFNHLPLRHIINPPVDMFDAKLARQIAIYVLHIDFDVPRRRLVSVLGVARWTVMQAVRTWKSWLSMSSPESGATLLQPVPPTR